MSYNRVDRSLFVIQNKPLDAKRGPWASTAEACANIPINRRDQGLTVGIIDTGSIVEYWWKDGIEDADLVAKSTGGSGSSLPPGGDAGQLLAKASATDYDVEWIDNYANWTSQLKHEVKLGEAISKGQAVYVSSADGTNMIVSKASNATEGTSSKTLGLLESGGSTNAKVKVITEGLLSGLNTATANAGDPVWLGTSGNLIFGLINKPTAPAHLVFIGVVTRANANNGEIFVKVQNGFELKELHDVQAQSPSGNDVLYFNSGDSQWKTASISTILGYTPGSGTVTSVSALTIGTSGTDLSSTVANGTTTPVITLNVPTASASNRGVLSSTDWSTFNGKQNALTNPVTGTGTNNEIAVFNSTGSTITSLPTSTYPSLTEFSYGKGVTSSIQTQLDNRSIGIATSGSVSITIGSTGTANLQSLTGHTFTIVESLMPVGATIQINGLTERLSGTGTGGVSYDINGTKRYINTPSGHQYQYQITLYRESSTTIRMMGGGAGQPFQGPFGSANQATTTGAVTSGGNIVFQLFGYGTVTNDVVAYRFFKAILTR